VFPSGGAASVYGKRKFSKKHAKKRPKLGEKSPFPQKKEKKKALPRGKRKTLRAEKNGLRKGG